MKTLIISINAKYIHSSLAAWYLLASCSPDCSDVSVMEFNINDHQDTLLSAICREKPDIVAFSCYIWNITLIVQICNCLRAVFPRLILIAGGPEVSFDTLEFMENNTCFDYIIRGEGEEAFPELIRSLVNVSTSGDKLITLAVAEKIPGLCYRDDTTLKIKDYTIIDDLSVITSPYSEIMTKIISGKIAYIEGSRGCPFACAYCLSSAMEGVRLFPLDRIFLGIEILVKSGARIIKFVDRTFNFHRIRALQIIEYILSGDFMDITFHFEISADLFDEKTLKAMALGRPGLFKIEAGIQTTNNTALASINRHSDNHKAISNLKRIAGQGNIHIHTDLIAGLPYEGMTSFGNSYDEVYNTGAHELQLGFLKLLKGSQMHVDVESLKRHEYIFKPYPPYEISGNKYLSCIDISHLKDVAALTDRYHNSGRFTAALSYIFNIRKGEVLLIPSPYEFFSGFAVSLNSKPEFRRNFIHGIQAQALYGLLFDYLKEVLNNKFSQKLSNEVEMLDCKDEYNQITEIFREMLIFDYLSSDPGRNIPKELLDIFHKSSMDRSRSCFTFNIKTVRCIDEIVNGVNYCEVENPDYKSFKVTLRFDYIDRDPVTGRFKYMTVK